MRHDITRALQHAHTDDEKLEALREFLPELEAFFESLPPYADLASYCVDYESMEEKIADLEFEVTQMEAKADGFEDKIMDLTDDLVTANASLESALQRVEDLEYELKEER